MQLTLVEKTLKLTKTNEPYYELWFEYPDGSKRVRYWVWSFVHNETNHLEAIWKAAVEAEVGRTYNLYYRKATISNRVQFVVNALDDVNKPFTYV